MILPIMRSVLVVLVLSFVIATSSVIGTGYVKKVSSSIFADSESVQSSHAKQNIKERIAALQQEISKLKREIETLPPGPAGPPSEQELKVIPVEGEPVTIPETESRIATATCPDGTLVTGGGYVQDPRGAGPFGVHIQENRAISSSTWQVQALWQDAGEMTIKAFALCASLE